MSATAPVVTTPASLPEQTNATRGLSPWGRAWFRFKSNRRGYRSLWIFGVIFIVCLFAELLSNDRPLMVKYDSKLYFPLFNDYPEKTFGGDFDTKADFLDPYIREKINEKGWLFFPPNRYRYDTINYFAEMPNPAPPSAQNWMGTDDRGRDVLARLVYGLRISLLFGFALTAIGVFVGVVAGAIQGYFGGRVDLLFQRFMEVWGSMPELYLLIIFASIFQPSIGLLLILLSMFGWMSLADYVRAEFLRGRNLEYVRAARAMGVPNRGIIWNHLLPNSMTPVITFLPFRISAAILALTSLDFLGLGVPPTTPSLGELLAQGKDNIEAWWISLSTFLVLVGSLTLLIFIGEALREAFDQRKG